MITYNIINPTALSNYSPTGYFIEYYLNDPQQTVYTFQCFSFDINETYHDPDNNEVIYRLRIKVMPPSSNYCQQTNNTPLTFDPNIMNYRKVVIKILATNLVALEIFLQNTTNVPGFFVQNYFIDIKIRIRFTGIGEDIEDVTVSIKTLLDPAHYKNKYDLIKTDKIGKDDSIVNTYAWNYHKRNKHTVSLSDVMFSEKHEYKFLNQQDRIFVKRTAVNNTQKVQGISGFVNQNYYLNIALNGTNNTVVRHADYVKRINWYDGTLYTLPIIHHRNGVDFFNNNDEQKQVYSSGFFGQRSSNIIRTVGIGLLVGNVIQEKMAVLAPNIGVTYKNSREPILQFFIYADYFDYKRFRLEKLRTIRRFLNAQNAKDSRFYFSVDYDKAVIVYDNYNTKRHELIFLNSSRVPVIDDVFLLKVSGNNTFYNILGHGGGYFLYYNFINNTRTINIIPWPKMILRRRDRLSLFYKEMAMGLM